MTGDSEDPVTSSSNEETDWRQRSGYVPYARPPSLERLYNLQYPQSKWSCTDTIAVADLAIQNGVQCNSSSTTLPSSSQPTEHFSATYSDRFAVFARLLQSIRAPTQICPLSLQPDLPEEDDRSLQVAPHHFLTLPTYLRSRTYRKYLPSLFYLLTNLKACSQQITTTIQVDELRA
ncbi:hypothetical protein BDZ97DRAFT_1920949 [Flammula alnicola]|nr:hypothetical protein BDZ97DRAFT_1920949 [Flammula alnicola]